MPKFTRRRLSARVGDLFKKRHPEITASAKVDERPPKIDEPTPVAPLENPASEALVPTGTPAEPVGPAPTAAVVVAAAAAAEASVRNPVLLPLGSYDLYSHYRRRKRKKRRVNGPSLHAVSLRVLVTCSRNGTLKSLPLPRSMNTLPRLMNLLPSPLLRTPLLKLLFRQELLLSPLGLLLQLPLL